MKASASIRVALAGNPNSGKTSIFNALTNGRQHVGNYPGVTVERREGHYTARGQTARGQTARGQRVTVVDLPGTYSLASYSPEERIAQQELLEGDFDVVVAVVDSTTLERSLVFVAQLMQLGANLILALNMSDEADEAGLRVDLDLMKLRLGFPVVRTVGHRGGGVDELARVIERAAREPRERRTPSLAPRVDAAISSVAAALPGAVGGPLRHWTATRLLLSDEAAANSLRTRNIGIDSALAEARRQRRKLESRSGRDITLQVTQGYYDFVEDLLRLVTIERARPDARARSNRIDAVLANRFLGLPLFLLVMYAIFWLTFTVGDVPMGWIEAGFDAAGEWVGSLWPEGSDSHLRSLLVDGVIAGVGGVVVFLPNIVLLFLGLAILEDTGYMSRAAFLMDRVMHRFGLHGRSFIPMMSGFGCSIPGIMATRTLEHERDRLTTMMVLPLMSCGARLPIWMLLIPAFYAPPWRAPVLWAIYVIGVALALVLALLLRSSLLRGQDTPFVMELAPYRLPTLRAVARKMTERSWIYLRKAGTVILGISVLMWFITAYPKPSSYEVDAAIAAGTIRVVDDAPAGDEAPSAAPEGPELISAAELDNRRAAEDLRYSIAGRVGGAMEPILEPMGFDWKTGTALLGAFAAKEVFVAQMGIVYSMGETDESSPGLQEQLASDYSPLAGFSLMLFLLIATPCMATVAVTRRESGSWKWAALQFGGLTAVGYLLALAVYQLGSLFT